MFIHHSVCPHSVHPLPQLVGSIRTLLFSPSATPRTVQIYIDIRHDERLAGHEGIRTNTLTPAGGVNKLTA